MFILMVVVFVLGYVAIALEHPLKIDKAAPALLIGVLTWVLYALGSFDIFTSGVSTAWNEYVALHPDANNQEGMMHFISHNQILESLGEISEILFFLLGAMTIVEIVDMHGGFNIITEKIKTLKKVKLLWILSFLTFFMSAALDNLTTTIVLVALLKKLIKDRETRWFFASMVVLAANAGGAVALNAKQFGDDADIVSALGMRVVDKSVNNLTLDGLLAWQFGRYNPKFDANARYDTVSAAKAMTEKRNAYAVQLGAAYDLKDVDMISKYSPIVSGSYTYLSGAKRDMTNVNRDDYRGWDPMFENQTQGHLINAIFANTNSHKFSVSGQAKLTDDVSAKLDYIGAWFARKYDGSVSNAGTVISGVFGPMAGTGRRFAIANSARYIGQEIDATLTYDYTEDVQFSLLGGILIAGDNVRDLDHTGKGNTANATELIGSMKVTF